MSVGGWRFVETGKVSCVVRAVDGIRAPAEVRVRGGMSVGEWFLKPAIIANRLDGAMDDFRFIHQDSVVPMRMAVELVRGSEMRMWRVIVPVAVWGIIELRLHDRC